MKHLNLIEKAFLLKKTFLFADLELESLLSIAGNLESSNVKASQYMFKTNQSAFQLYIIESGTMVLLDSDDEPLIELNSGDLFGDEALFKDQVHQYHAQAKVDSRLLSLTKKHLTTIIAECPSVAINLIEAFARQVNFRHPIPIKNS